jgi:hypothetical protein
MSDGEALDQKGGNASRLELGPCCCGHRVSHAGRQEKPGSAHIVSTCLCCPAGTLVLKRLDNDQKDNGDGRECGDFIHEPVEPATARVSTGEKILSPS